MKCITHSNSAALWELAKQIKQRMGNDKALLFIPDDNDFLVYELENDEVNKIVKE